MGRGRRLKNRWTSTRTLKIRAKRIVGQGTAKPKQVHFHQNLFPSSGRANRSFDIFKDQQTALEKLQLAAVDAGHKKPKLGDMVQEAIDLYVEKWAKKLPNVRLNKRSNE